MCDVENGGETYWPSSLRHDAAATHSLSLYIQYIYLILIALLACSFIPSRLFFTIISSLSHFIILFFSYLTMLSLSLSQTLSFTSLLCSPSPSLAFSSFTYYPSYEAFCRLFYSHLTCTCTLPPHETRDLSLFLGRTVVPFSLSLSLLPSSPAHSHFLSPSYTLPSVDRVWFIHSVTHSHSFFFSVQVTERACRNIEDTYRRMCTPRTHW